MEKAPLPPNEQERLEALRRYEILDTSADQELDDITAMAAAICGTPVALVSLVDRHRQWFKSKIGVQASETPRDIAFCAYGILGRGPFIVPDTQVDPRFADNPLATGDPPLRFYAGIPLMTPDGYAVGMLCVNDRVPRHLSPQQVEALQTLARQVMTRLELKRSQEELRRFNQNLEQRIAERTEEIQRQAEALAQAERMSVLGRFAAGVAHDINNPVGAILGFSEEMLRRLPGNDPLRMPLESIQREGNRCQALVRNLLAFSRSGKPGGSRAPEDLQDVVEGALALVETLSKTRGVQLIRQYGGSLPRLEVDRQQIQQIVINLCTNAIDAMPQGGRLHVGLTPAAGGVTLSVADTGAGIAPEIREKIFDAFFTTKEPGRGTGLGLSLISNFVKNHGGTIEFDTEVGRGTTFRIHLRNPDASSSADNLPLAAAA